MPDGTFIPGEGSSNLVSFLDGLFPGGSGSDLTARPWFSLFEQSVDYWNKLSGVQLHYEPADDGVNLRGLRGSEGVRGDIRLGGAFIDGTTGPTLASTGFLQDADITIDTGDEIYYGNPAPNDTYQNFQNTVTHEFGHALGLGHIYSNNAIFLMEPFTNATIVGPQLDDIRGMHYLYGDVNEKSHGGVGNGSVATTTQLGSLPLDQEVLLGEHAATGTFVLPDEEDFLSTSGSADVDYFSFEVLQPTRLDVQLTPVGATYNERINPTDLFTSTNSSRVSDLNLELLAQQGESAALLVSADENPIGEAESIVAWELPEPGTYYVRIAGDSSGVQLYQLSLFAATYTPEMSGDFNGDQRVDALDFLHWQRDNSVGDLADWESSFGTSPEAITSNPIPEPSSICLFSLTVLASLNQRFYEGAERFGFVSPPTG